MMQLSESYPDGTDYEWYGVDSCGHVAVFTSAGCGPIPAAILAKTQEADRLSDMVWNLPKRCQTTMVVSLPRPDDYLFFASRGLFAYDWRDGRNAFFS